MPITVEEACANIGRAVVYRAGHLGAPAEQGIITSANDRYVFVRYGATEHGVATPPDKLEWMADTSWGPHGRR